jgi:cell division protein FtsQ
MEIDTLKTYIRHALRLLGVAAAIGGVLALGLLGWQWQASATVSEIAVTGTRHAPPDTLRRLAEVDSGAVMGTLDRRVLADRIERHPWVKTAEVVMRRATGTMAVRVSERVPVALAIGADGAPAYYLDAAGYGMPLAEGTAYDVPLVRGLDAAYHPLRRLAPPALQGVLAALRTKTDGGLVGAIQVRPDSSVGLVTAPIGAHGPIAVEVGRGAVPHKLDKLRAFARRVLRARPDAPIEQIDLRFDGQVVTRNQLPGG